MTPPITPPMAAGMPPEEDEDEQDEEPEEPVVTSVEVDGAEGLQVSPESIRCQERVAVVEGGMNDTYAGAATDELEHVYTWGE